MAEPSRVLPATIESVAPARVVIIEARYYDSIGAALLAGASDALAAAGAGVEVVSLPGALEIPIGLSILLHAAEAKGQPFDAAVVLGCVIRGETYHFEIVANDSCRSVMEVALLHRLPLGNGILTVENEAQAEVRARDKGADAARAALALLRLKRQAEAR